MFLWVLQKCRKRRGFIFVVHMVEVAVVALAEAAKTIGDPIHYYESMGSKFCANYLMSNDEADRLREAREEELMTAQAISIVKDISFGAAIKSYSLLSSAKQRKIQANPDIQRAIERLRDISDTVISLDDLAN